MLIILSTTLLFGHWTAFYVYLGNGPSDNLAFVGIIYQHFFGVFIDFDLYVPEILNISLNDISISSLLSALNRIPTFDNIPPAEMLESSTIFSALGLVLALMKPLVCLLSYFFHLAGMVGDNKKIGNVAESVGSLEGILTKLDGEARNKALARKHMICKTNEGGKLTELCIDESQEMRRTFLLDIKVAGSSKFYLLLKLNFRDCSTVTGE